MVFRQIQEIGMTQHGLANESSGNTIISVSKFSMIWMT